MYIIWGQFILGMQFYLLLLRTVLVDAILLLIISSSLSIKLTIDDLDLLKQ